MSFIFELALFFFCKHHESSVIQYFGGKSFLTIFFIYPNLNIYFILWLLGLRISIYQLPDINRVGIQMETLSFTANVTRWHRWV
jgi:hypothetical protein